MNDWLDYKGSNSSRYYLSHGIFSNIIQEQRQAIADERLRRAQEKKSLTIT